MWFLIGCLAGSICCGIACYFLKAPTIGTIFMFEDDSMYVQLDSDESFYEMHERPYAIFRIKHRHPQK